MSQAFERALQRVMRRLQNVVGRGRLTKPVDDTGVAQRGQLRTRSGNHANDVPMVGLFGFSSSPPVDSDVTYIAFAGDSSSMVVIGTGHQGSRPKNTPAGGTILYDQGNSCVLLNNDGSIKIGSSNGSVVLMGTDGSIIITPQNGVVTLNGSMHVTGDVIFGYGGADQVSGLHHAHTSEGVGSATSAPTPGT